MISIILPVYNAEKYLSKAIESLLSQTLREFELICINDGSTDSSKEIIKKYMSKDDRIILIDRENKGLIYSLNEGLKLAKYNYIARMDADDICKSRRLESQLDFMKKNQDVAVLGCSYDIIDENESLVSSRSPAKSFLLLKASLIFGSPLAHPTVMFNKTLLGNDLYYSPDYPCAEDYELWLRLSKKYKITNLKENLFCYRVIATSVSRINQKKQLDVKKKAASEYLIINNKKDTFLKSKFYLSNNKFEIIKLLLLQDDKKYLIFQIIFVLLKR